MLLCSKISSARMGQLLCMKLKKSPVLHQFDASLQKNVPSRKVVEDLTACWNFMKGKNGRGKKKSGLLTWSKNSELSKANPEMLSMS